MAADFEKILEQASKGRTRPVYLFLGEDPAVTRSHARQLISKLLPGESERASNLLEFEGAGQDVSEIVMSLKTGSLIAGKVVVAWFDADLFGTHKARGAAKKDVSRIETLWRRGEKVKAAGLFLSVSLRCEMEPEKLDPEAFDPEWWLEAAGVQSSPDLVEVIRGAAEYRAEKEMRLSSAGEAAKVLERGLDAGFNPSSVLVLTARKASASDSLLKKIKKEGEVIQVGLARDRRSSTASAMRHLKRLCSDLDLDLPGDVLQVIAERSSPDPELLRLELEKVASLAESKGRLSKSDVQALVHKTREEPMWELTSAVSDRNSSKALAALEEQFGKGVHELILFGAIANEWRRLCFVSFEAPDLVRRQGDRPDRLGTELKERISARGKGLGKELLGNRKPYSLGLLAKKASRFEQDELLNGFKYLLAAEGDLKGGAEPAKNVLTRLVISLLE